MISDVTVKWSAMQDVELSTNIKAIFDREPDTGGKYSENLRDLYLYGRLEEEEHRVEMDLTRLRTDSSLAS